MSAPPSNIYKIGDVVWVKLRTMWWPAVVCGEEHLPDTAPPIVSKNRPIAIVRFFGERTYEIIRNSNQILPYNCPKKYDFILKGLVLFRKDHDYAIKFPSDVQLSEKRCGGDVNMFERDDEFTLAPIDEKTAKLLAQKRKERGEPWPGEHNDDDEDSECPYHEDHVREQLESSKHRELQEYECPHEHLRDRNMPSTSMGYRHDNDRDSLDSRRALPSTSRAYYEDIDSEQYAEHLRVEAILREQLATAETTLRTQMEAAIREQLKTALREQLIQQMSQYTDDEQLQQFTEDAIFKKPMPPGRSPPLAMSFSRSPSSSRSPSATTTSPSKLKPTSPISSDQSMPSTPRVSRESMSPDQGQKRSSSMPSPHKYRKIRIGNPLEIRLPLMRDIPPRAAPIREPKKPPPPKQEEPPAKKKRGRKKKDNLMLTIPPPPPPGCSRLRGESYIHIKDIYEHLAERLAQIPSFTDRSKPLPLYLRPESIWRPKKVVPNWRENVAPPVNLLHPIPAEIGEYKCHLCKYSCNRQNNIISHIKLHNYGKCLKAMARKIYVKYVKRLILDEQEIIEVVDSDEEQDRVIPPPDADCTYTDYTIHCSELSSDESDENNPQRNKKKKKIRKKEKPFIIIPVYKKIDKDKATPDQKTYTSREAILRTREIININRRRAALLREIPQRQLTVEEMRDLPSTSGTSRQLPSPTSSQGSRRSSDSNMSINSDDSDTRIIEELIHCVPPRVLQAEARVRYGMPPIPAVQIPLRRAVCLPHPIRYIPPWKQAKINVLRRGIGNPLHYLPPRPHLIMPYPKPFPSSKKPLPSNDKPLPSGDLDEDTEIEEIESDEDLLHENEEERIYILAPQPGEELPEEEEEDEEPQPKPKKHRKKRRHEKSKKQAKTTTTEKTDNENVREILKDWDDDETPTTTTTTNPIPTTSRQSVNDENDDRNITDDQHPIRLEDAVGMLRQIHAEDDDDAQLNSPARKIRNIPKKDRARLVTDLTAKARKHCDDVIELAEDVIRDDTPDELILIDDNNIQITTTTTSTRKAKLSRRRRKRLNKNQPSTSKTEDNDDKNTDSDMITEGNLTTPETSNDSDTHIVTNITAEPMEDVREEDNGSRTFKETENEKILKLNVENVETITTCDKRNTIQIIENIQIFPSKPLLTFSSNENNDSITSSDKKLVEEIVEKINEVNDSIIEKNIVQSEEIVIKINEINENIKENTEILLAEENTKNVIEPLLELNDNIDENNKDIPISSIEYTAEMNTCSIQLINIPESPVKILETSENIPETSVNIPESLENIPESLENVPEISECMLESTEQLTDIFPTTTKIQTNNDEEKTNEINRQDRESSLDIAIRDLITPFEPTKKLPPSRKSSKRGEIQPIRKSSRKSDNIYKILGREITTPSPSLANMAANETDLNQSINSTSSIDDSSNSATETTIKSTGRGRRSKKILNKSIINETEIIIQESIDDTILRSKNDSVENIVEEEQSIIEGELHNIEDENSVIIPKNSIDKTLEKDILITDEQVNEEDKETVENVKSSRKSKKPKHNDEQKSPEREEIPKIIIKTQKNSDESSKIIMKMTSTIDKKQLQENSPKKRQKLQSLSPEIDKSINLITSTTNDIPSISSTTDKIAEAITEEKQEIIIQKSAISCFDFNEDEDDNEIILTPLNKLKKKYMSPPGDKYKDEIDNKKMKDTERKDQLLSTEIENILNNTKVPELKKIDMIAETSNVITKPSTSTTADNQSQIVIPTSSSSSSFDGNNQDVKGLPIKERGKRFFKSRNRPKPDENLINLTNTGVVPIDLGCLKGIQSTNLNQDKNITDIQNLDDKINELKTINIDIAAITEETSIEIKNISQQQTDNTIKSTVENIEIDGVSLKTTSENELFIAETLLSFPNTVTETTTSTLRDLENINLKLQNLKEDQKQQQQHLIEPITTENLSTIQQQQPMTEKRTQIRVKSLEKLNQQFEDSLLQEKDIGKPAIDIVKSSLPLEHITRRRRSHLKITPRKRVLQQPVKLETNTNINESNETTINLVKNDENNKSDDTINVPVDNDNIIDPIVSESNISETKITDTKKNEDVKLDAVQVIEEPTAINDSLTIEKIIETTTESKTVTQEYEENFVEKYMKDSRILDVTASTEKNVKEVNKTDKVLDNKKEMIENISNSTKSPIEIVKSPQIIIDSEPLELVSSTETINNKNVELDNEQSTSAATKLTPLAQSISDIRSFRPRRKTSNKRSPSFCSEYPLNRRSSTELQVEIVDNKIENADEPTTTTTTTSSIQISDSTSVTTTTTVESIPNITDTLDIIKPTEKLTIDPIDEQRIQHHQLSPTIEKIQINVDLSNPLTSQIAKIFAANNPVMKPTTATTTTDEIPTTTLIAPPITKLLTTGQQQEERSGTMKRKSTIEEEIPMFFIEKTKPIIEQEDGPPEKIQKTIQQPQGIKSEIINKIPQSSQFSTTNKNTLGSGKLIITQLREQNTELQDNKYDLKLDQSDMSNIFDITNMPIYIANESTLPFVVTTTATGISQPVTVPVNTTAIPTTTTAVASTTIIKRQGRGRPRKVYQTTTIISTTPITTITSSMPKYTSTSQQTFNKPVTKNIISYGQQQHQQQQINNNTNINNYPIHQTHTQQILDSQNYNLLQSANNNSTAAGGKEVGIDSKGNRFILIKQGNSQKMVKQSPTGLPSSSSADINKSNFTMTTNPLQQQSSDMSNINVISSDLIIPPKQIKTQTQTTNLIITKRLLQQEEEVEQHQPEKKMNLLGQSAQFVITSKGAVIQSSQIMQSKDCTSQTLTSNKLMTYIKNMSLPQIPQQQVKFHNLNLPTHSLGDTPIIQQQPSTSSDINQQIFIESNLNIVQQQQPLPPLTKGKITTTSQRGRKRKNDNIMICYNQNQLEMPPLTAIQQNSPTTSTNLKNFPQQLSEPEAKKLKLLEKQEEILNRNQQQQQTQIPSSHSIDEVTNQLVTEIDNTINIPTTSTDDELQNKIMAVPANHFGIPGNAYYLCSQSLDGDYLPIDSQKLYLDPDVNQLVPLTCLSKNALAKVLATEEAAEAAAATQHVQQEAIVLHTDDTDALIEETTEIDQSEIDNEMAAKHNMEIQLIAAQHPQQQQQQQVALVSAEQQNIEKINNETVLIEQTTSSNRQYIVESGPSGGADNNIVGATVGATATAAASNNDIVDNMICLDIDENQQQVIAIDESNVISDISAAGNSGIQAPVTTSAITPVAAENLLTAEDVSGFLGSDQSIVINVDGQQLILDQQSFLALAATGGESAQLETAEGQTYILSREFLAALGIGAGGGGGIVNANVTENISNNDDGSGVVNDDTQLLLHHGSGSNHDILAAALAGTEVFYQQQQDHDLLNLQIETSNGMVQQLVGEEQLTFQHLTPPVTAQTNETSALLTQPPIMSVLEVPSNKNINKSNKIYNNKNSNELQIDNDNILTNINNNNSNNRLLTTTVPPQNLDDCIAFIGVSTQSSTVPSSLELPITITNPAIAPPKNSTNPIDDTIFNTKGLGVTATTIGNIICGSSSSQISPHLITCNGEQELQYELFTTTQTTSQQQQQQQHQQKSANNSQTDDVFQSNFDDPTR